MKYIISVHDRCEHRVGHKLEPRGVAEHGKETIYSCSPRVTISLISANLNLYRVLLMLLI